MSTLRRPRLSHVPPTAITPSGWLRRQLELQARGLAGNLDRIWPDVRDSQWLGGDREGWERVPYWLDGFIPLAFLLQDDGLKARAKRYVDAILARQHPDGWLCPSVVVRDAEPGKAAQLTASEEESRAKYDTWAVLLLAKVLVLYHDCTGDQDVLAAVRKALLQFSDHLDRHPLFNWGRHRWFEGLVAIRRLLELLPTSDAGWLRALADKLRRQGLDYRAFMLSPQWDHCRLPQDHWNWDAHVVNYAMALKAPLLHASLFPDDHDAHPEFARQMLDILRQHHGTAFGLFTGDEMLSGTSPVKGTELCAVVEAMFSAETNFALSADTEWLDLAEQLAFNALPAACSPDMWTHQYDQQANQIGCVHETSVIWSCNDAFASRYGLEPHFGCCTANFGQGWPKLALNAFLRDGDDTIVSAALVPARLDCSLQGADVTVELATRYPFAGRLVYTVTASRPTDFTLAIRIPAFAAHAAIDGQDTPAGQLARLRRTWSGTTTVIVQLDFETRLERRPSSLHCLWRGPLLFALPIPYTQTRDEYTDKGVERKFPYCDYETLPAGPWAFALDGADVTVEERELGALPFAQETPPVVLHARMRPLDWRVRDGFRAVADDLPVSTEPIGPAINRELVPYGSTMLRMTELPLVGQPLPR